MGTVSRDMPSTRRRDGAVPDAKETESVQLLHKQRARRPQKSGH